ncbi:MAG: DUF502 domain-containing protein [Pirellulales bacterium]|nr:DUF502 domain-containing protein [Pirellulales bacterium]
MKPFRRAVLGGLGVFLPPLLTILCFIWVGTTIHYYVIDPVEAGARNLIAIAIADIREPEDPDSTLENVTFDGVVYQHTDNNRYVPQSVYDVVRIHDGDSHAGELPAQAIYRRYVELQFLKPHLTVPLILAVFVIALWLLGKLLAGGFGGLLWTVFERGVNRIPLVSNVYSSVKQVTDFLVRGSDVPYTKVVAVEYPRKQTWSLGFVTGESLLDIRAAANEPVLAVLIPTSPMPMTGFTVTVLKSEVLDLNMTVDQALQYLVSCGVVVPSHQLAEALEAKAAAEAADTDKKLLNQRDSNGQPEVSGENSSTSNDPIPDARD